MSGSPDEAREETAIREVVESWAAAVRRRDIDAILRNHSADIVMFDVPPPFQTRGIEGYRRTWETFFSWTTEPIPFDFAEMSITAGRDVGFVVATLHCAEPGPDGGAKPLQFRLTVGLRKIDGRWMITHEHHSVPSAD